jgi:hypothetical protein
MEADPPLFDECSATNRTELEKDDAKREAAMSRWQKLQADYDEAHPKDEPEVKDHGLHGIPA